MQHRLLVVEGEATSHPSVHTTLAGDGAFDLQRVDWDEFAPMDLGRRGEHLVIAVVGPHTPRVASVFEWLNRNPIGTPTFAVLPVEADEELVRLVMRTADDFIFPPVRAVELRHRVGRLLAEAHDLDAVRARLREEMGLTKLVGRDPLFLRAIEQVPRFARAEASVLVTGETGTGKELCARAIHHLGRRRSFPFIAIDCGALPDQLFENEVFGHVRGAFTDAHRDHKGLIAMAQGGTLFLDEVDALSLAAQAKLLRFLQEHTFRALGSDHFEQADVRVIAATNRDLEACVKEKQFRSDLFFRLNILRLHLPPLRERCGDIELLAHGILRESRTSVAVSPKAFSTAAMRMLTLHDWPGNVRELCNVVQRAVVACDGDRILPSHIGLSPDRTAAPEVVFRAAKAAAVAAFERRYVEELLRKHRGNVTHAAREAQQDRRAFGRVIKRHQINPRAL
jgi:two-component system, NtrC family, response regulator GlrR